MAGQSSSFNAIFSGRWRAKRARPASVGDGGGRGLPFRTAATFSSRRIAEPSGEAWGPGLAPARNPTAAPRRVGVAVLTKKRPPRPALHTPAETLRDSLSLSLTPITETLVSLLRTRQWKGTGAPRHTYQQQEQPRPGRQKSPSLGTPPPGPPTKEPTPSPARRIHTTIPNSTPRNSKKTKGNRLKRVSFVPARRISDERKPAQRSPEPRRRRKGPPLAGLKRDHHASDTPVRLGSTLAQLSTNNPGDTRARQSASSEPDHRPRGNLRRQPAPGPPQEEYPQGVHTMEPPPRLDRWRTDSDPPTPIEKTEQATRRN